MSVIGDELTIFGIVSRLPAKDVTQYKSVSKEWNRLLSTHGFENTHFKYASTCTAQKTLIARRLHCSVYSVDNETGSHRREKIISYPRTKGLKGITILGHVIGILCVCLQPSHELVLWNPTTGSRKQISFASDINPFNYVDDTVGLFERNEKDFNVLRVITSDAKLTAKIYSRRNSTWWDISFTTNTEYARKPYMWSVGTLCGEALYFVVSNYWDTLANLIIKFDTRTECVTQITFPPVPIKSIFEVFVTSVENTLHMVILTTPHNNNDKTIGIWSLGSDCWSNHFPSPPIPPLTSSTWLTVTHYISNGTWYVMSGRTPLYAFKQLDNPLHSFYSTNNFRLNQGAMFFESITSTSYED